MLEAVNDIQKNLQTCGLYFKKSVYRDEKSKGVFKRQKKLSCRRSTSVWEGHVLRDGHLFSKMKNCQEEEIYG